MGNPHAVLLVEDINTAPVTLLGPLVETHKSFPQKVNVGFLQIIDKSYGKLRVWERGVGETQACGTGACAAAVAAITQGLMLSPVHLELPGGMLSIEWDQIDQPVVMIGEAIHVYEGSINYD
ncbi:UNVERIFIED_CONTAM: hypothetical protein GTU68_060415 [Idotea baltica]|nr:hypothetical protein [Idotea baltica]